MPISKSITEGKASALKKESVSSASQLSNFGVRLAKFKFSFDLDGGSDFSSGLVLPSACAILSISLSVSEAFAGAADVDIIAGATEIANLGDISATTGIIAATIAAQASGELGIKFNGDAPTAGEAVVAVSFVDLSEIK